MSIVDDRMHVVGDPARDEHLWQTADPTPIGSKSALRTPSCSSSGDAGAPAVFNGADSGDDDQMWQTRIDLVVSTGLSGDAMRKSDEEERRAYLATSFDTLCTLCRDELRPVLESSAEMLTQRGLSARVTETLKDEPARVPRSFDLNLSIDPFGDREPGKLTITATEGCDFARVKLAVGPSKMGGDISEHVGTTLAEDLSGGLVGGLVATLVEQIFSS